MAGRKHGIRVLAEKTRAFIALDLPGSVRNVLACLQDQLRQQRIRARWVPPANVHLTLRFLGEIPSDTLAQVAAVVEDSVFAVPAFDLVLQGMGAFPTFARARVIWAGLGGAVDALAAFKKRLDEDLMALDPVRFPAERRVFKGHLTLARIKSRPNPREFLNAMTQISGFAALAFCADALVLYKSQLTAAGALYTPLCTCRLLRKPVGGA